MRVRVESTENEDFVGRHVAGVMVSVARVVLQNTFVALVTPFAD